MKRRPSFAAVIALLALFVALGGPAHAERAIDRMLPRGSVSSAEIKDRTVKLRDLNRRTVRELRATPDDSIDEAKLANRSVTPGKLATGAVGPPALADHSVGAVDLAIGGVGTQHVADGSLRVTDFARFSGRFRATLDDIPVGRCWSGEPTGLAPERVAANISDDLVLVSPDSRWIERRVTFTVRASSNPSRFVLAACNVGAPIGEAAAAVPSREVGFRYVIIELP